MNPWPNQLFLVKLRLKHASGLFKLLEYARMVLICLNVVHIILHLFLVVHYMFMHDTSFDLKSISKI